jgi:hypothetical protein
VSCHSCRIPDDDVTAELERLRAENAQLKRTANRGVSLKVSEKCSLSAADNNWASTTA